MPYEIQVKTIKKQRFSTLHDSIKPHDYPSDWNKPHDTLFDQNMGGIKQTCGINQPCGQYRTREYTGKSRQLLELDMELTQAFLKFSKKLKVPKN